MELTLNQKSDNFSKLLHEAAALEDCLFFEDSGEGNDMETDTLYCENVSGWLVPLRMKDEFINSDKGNKRWDKYFVFAEWKQGESNRIVIDFVKYPIYYEQK